MKTNKFGIFHRRGQDSGNNAMEQTQHKGFLEENKKGNHFVYGSIFRNKLRRKGFLGPIACLAFFSLLCTFKLSSNSTTMHVCNNMHKNSNLIPLSIEGITLNSGVVNSAPGVTGPGIPSLMKQILQETGKNIDDTLDTSFAAEAAVNALEDKCKWVPEETNFQDKACFEKVNFETIRESFHADPSLIDIVTPSIRNLDFLNQWREFFQGFHVIIIQDGNPDTHLEIPEWVDYELYNRHDIEKALGADAWIISSKDASIRNFGFLVSKKPYIYTIDDDCLPALDMNGYAVNPLAAHLQNLLTPSNPYFFNTLYDPYASNSDFVRGYPYSLRKGVKTAISHGLWMFTPDYDAPTQLLKPTERNSNYLDMALTIPFKTLYPMCSMNVAFARELIGPAFMQGLMGEGQPWARYDDMFAGWASKVVADHLGFGVKSGKPYIYHNKLSNPFTNLKKEYQGLFWQEDIIRFFANEVEFSTTANTPIKAYVELALQIRARFSTLHPYFDRLATSMVLWTEVWDKVSSGAIRPVPSRVADPSVRERFVPLNLSIRGHALLNKETILRKTFPSLYPSKKVVTANDIENGHSFKTFLVPLDVKFHDGAIDNIMDLYFSGRQNDLPADFYYKDGDKPSNLQPDYFSESIILKKLLASLDFVQNVEDADLILVPALPTIACRWPLKRCNDGSELNQWYQNLHSQVETFAPKDKTSGKKFLYLATQDTANIFDRDHFSNPNNLVVTLGPAVKENVLVAPSLNLMKELQPSHWEGCKPIEERKVFLSANFGIRKWLKDRITISKELDAYNGTKTISREMFARGRRDLVDSLLVISAPGDLPFQKRFYDAILQCTIPVVISREVKGIGKTYWSNVKYGKFPPFPIDKSYPPLPFGVSYSDFVFEVDGKVIEEGNLMKYLESIKEEDFEMKLKNITKFRNRFVYDLEGSSEDAFSIMLEELAMRLKSKK